MKLGQDQFHASTRDSWNQSDLDQPFRHHTSDGPDRWTAETRDLHIKGTSPDGLDSHWEHWLSGPGPAGIEPVAMFCTTKVRTCLDARGWRSQSQVWGQVSLLTVRTSCQQRHVSSSNHWKRFLCWSSWRRRHAAPAPSSLSSPGKEW